MALRLKFLWLRFLRFGLMIDAHGFALSDNKPALADTILRLARVDSELALLRLQEHCRVR